MAQVIVRNLEDSVKHRLQRRAARHGRSMEEEVREIIRDAVEDESRTHKGLGTAIAERFRGLGFADEIKELRGYTIDPADSTDGHFRHQCPFPL